MGNCFCIVLYLINFKQVNRFAARGLLLLV